MARATPPEGEEDLLTRILSTLYFANRAAFRISGTLVSDRLVRHLASENGGGQSRENGTATYSETHFPQGSGCISTG